MAACRDDAATLGVLLVVMRQIAFLLLFFGYSSAIAAGPVRLIDSGSEFVIEADLTHFDGEFFHLTDGGVPFAVLADDFRCEGVSCPRDRSDTITVSFSGPQRVMRELMPQLLKEYASAEGFNIQEEQNADSGFKFNFFSQTSEKIAEIYLSIPSDREDFETDWAFDISAGLTPLVGAQTASINQNDGVVIVTEDKVLAYDAMVPVASSENPVDIILEQDLLGILSGDITNWSELGGPDLDIRVFLTRNYKTLLQAALGPDIIIAPAKLRLASDRIAEVIESDASLLGLVPFHAAQGLNELRIRNTCGFDAHASAFSIEAGEYPLAFGYGLSQMSERPPKFLRKWHRFLTSSVAYDTADDAGYVASTPTPLPLEDQGVRVTRSVMSAGPDVKLADLQRLARILTEAERLSTTFRVGKISTADKIRSLSDAEALIEYVRSSDMSGKKLVFLGFTDNSGEPQTNLKLSAERAEDVREFVLNLAIDRGVLMPPVEALGLGEAAPIGCNETAHGQRLNRRVEIWIKDR